MPIPTTPRSIPTLKKFLFEAYQELNSIEARIRTEYWSPPLSDLEKAVILLEDRRYFAHSAIDWRSFVREVYKKLTFRKHGGASTIEMQFVRTCTGYREHTFRRKLYEMFLAWALLHRASKSEILRSYLQVAYFGANLRGIVRTSRSLYGKNPDDLNEEESFVLASMLVYPRPKVPSESWKNKVSRRAGYGLRLLTKIGPVALK